MMTRTSKFALSAASIGLALPVSSFANEASPALTDEQKVAAELRKEAAEELNDSAAVLLAEGSPNDRAMAGFRRPIVNFEAEQGEKAVSLAFSFDLLDHQPVDVSGDGNFFRVNRTKLSVVGSTPIEEGDPTSRIFKGDSLVNGSKLRLSISRVSNTLGTGEVRRGTSSRQTTELILESHKKCIPLSLEAWRQTNGKPAAFSNDARALIDKSLAIFQNHEDALGRIRKSQFEQRLEGNNILISALRNQADALYKEQKIEAGQIDYVFFQCIVKSTEGEHRYADSIDLVKGMLGQDISDRFFNENSNFTFMGIDATVGQDSYSYLDSAAFENTDASRTSWEVGAYYGLINWNSTHSARVRAVYGKEWKLADETETCRTFVETMEEKCLMGPDGPPKSNMTGLVSLETRHRFKISETEEIALAPQVTYRFDDKNLGVEVPVYLAPDKDGKLTGGLKFGYNSKGDDFGIGLFVGIPFSIFFD